MSLLSIYLWEPARNQKTFGTSVTLFAYLCSLNKPVITSPRLFRIMYTSAAKCREEHVIWWHCESNISAGRRNARSRVPGNRGAPEIGCHISRPSSFMCVGGIEPGCFMPQSMFPKTRQQLLQLCVLPHSLFSENIFALIGLNFTSNDRTCTFIVKITYHDFICLCLYTSTVNYFNT